MNEAQRKLAAKNFSEEWLNEIKTGNVGEIKNNAQFWIDLLQNVFEIKQPKTFIKFEFPVKVNKVKKRIDALIPEAKVLIEQKGPEIDLSTKEKQSDGTFLTPFEQGKRYADNLPYSQKPRWIIACNFKEFHIYDMNKVPFKPKIISLENLSEEIHKLKFLTDVTSNPLFDQQKVKEFSLEAGRRVREIYKALEKQYIAPEDDEAQKKLNAESLNALCVRLVFCLYAEDAGMFERDQFYHYMHNNRGGDCGRSALIKLFKILDKKEDERQEFQYESDDLLAFPHVNGGLFEDELIIPKFNDEIFLTLTTISENFDWSSVSPTIFGALFESTLNPVTRNTDGMHYTSIENIHKVIKPLFLDDLKKEFEQITKVKVPKTRERKLENFQNKLASIKILDPACGSGNFLTESYIQLRTLENEVLKALNGLQMVFDVDCIKVKIHQFYGIEINDFAVKVAQTAMRIAENQMKQETQMIVSDQEFEFLPLENYTNIIEANALKINWADLVKPSELSYIIGNPPFAGSATMSRAQKAETLEIFKGWKNVGKLDYVTNWFKVASDYIDGTPIRCALLATNSICQGEHVSILWKPIFKKIHFDFAYRTFKWLNEAANMAQVSCIILGFSQAENSKPKLIFDDNNRDNDKKLIPTVVKNINAYLLNADNIFVEAQSKPISNVSVMSRGNDPVEGVNLILSPQEKNELLKKYPEAKKFVRPFMGAEEFVKRKERYCLWLVDSTEDERNNCPEIKRRVELVREFRLKSKRVKTNQGAVTPHLFEAIRQPDTNYLVMPEVSTSSRQYIPIGFLDKNIIPSNKLFTVANATLYEFGVITSKVHMAWMRLVAGRFGTAYNYSNTIVYNTFVWCEPTDEQKEKIKQTAQKILDVRENNSSKTYAELYDEEKMPYDLRKAHEENDKAVIQAYGFNLNFSEADIVRELLNLYEKHKTK